MDWFHCNVCYARPESDEDATRFSASNCGHVFCDPCVQRLQDSTCPKCGEECRLVRIDQNIPKSIAVYFRSLNSILKKLKNLNKEVAELFESFQRGKKFQDTQREHLMAHLLAAAQRPPSPPGQRITTEQAQQIKDKHASDAQLIEALQQELHSLKALMKTANLQYQQQQQYQMHSRPPTASSMNRSIMMASPTQLVMSPAFGQACRPEPPSAARILPSRASNCKAPSAQIAHAAVSSSSTSSRHTTTSAAPAGFMPASRVVTRTPAPQPFSRLSGPPVASASTPYGTRSVVGATHSAGRSGILQQQPPAAGRMSAGSSHSDVSMRTVSTVRTSGSTLGYQHLNGGGSSGSSRIVEGPTFNPRDQLYVKQRRA
ncbi:hypothetical protein RvY_06390 [Ramazzottius varieornatus]|uniref:RING-type domain-containing protein n=1 Tax=Ramazzottius varieornatus TaxID=947166 RepID=A0A1D1V820_RAMVA|nr:hypothetical protein RvY_06390 [Ramazzottius varieornatus]